MCVCACVANFVGNANELKVWGPHVQTMPGLARLNLTSFEFLFCGDKLTSNHLYSQ